MDKTEVIIRYLEKKEKSLLDDIENMPGIDGVVTELDYIRSCIRQLKEGHKNAAHIYHNEVINNMREELEEEFREQYDICCGGSTEWERKFKIAFEDLVEAFYNLDNLIK